MSRTSPSTSLLDDARRAPVKVTGAQRLQLRAAAAALLALLLLAGVAGPGLAAESRASLSGVVNLNTASSEQLQMLPGVGEVRANAIIDARKKNGGFKSVDDLVEVKGVGPSLLEKLRPYVAVTGKTTIKAL